MVTHPHAELAELVLLLGVFAAVGLRRGCRSTMIWQDKIKQSLPKRICFIKLENGSWERDAQCGFSSSDVVGTARGLFPLWALCLALCSVPGWSKEHRWKPLLLEMHGLPGVCSLEQRLRMPPSSGNVQDWLPVYSMPLEMLFKGIRQGVMLIILSVFGL